MIARALRWADQLPTGTRALGCVVAGVVLAIAEVVAVGLAGVVAVTS